MESPMRVSIALLALLVAGCNSTPYYQDEAHYQRDYQKSVTEQDGRSPVRGDADKTQDALLERDKAAAQAYANLVKSRERQAYREGVQDTLEDFRGKMQARQGFVWEPPVVDYVEVPGAVRNGAYVPAHREAVILSPGRWIEANGEMLPTADGEGHGR